MTALLAASCIKDEPRCSTCDENPDGRGILLSFNDGTDTRSTLQSSEVDYKDVKDVYLYVFEGTGSEAECILSEDVDWKGDISQQHWISTDLNTGTYTFLAVGVDDKAGAVYGLTDKYTGSLGECLAKLAQGKDKSDMATAQIFAGQTTQTVAEEDDVVEVGVTLTRKVAGVLAYLRNIPCKVDFTGAEGGKADVTGIRLVLAQPQNTQMPMWPIATDENPVYGQEPMNDTEKNKILFSYNLADIGFEPDEDERYFVKETQEDNILPNTLLYGAYLLPIENTTQNNTLKLELTGSYTDINNEHDNEVVKIYTIQNPDGASTFSLEENKLYSIGKKLSDNSTDGDKPADLSGNILQVNVVKWCEQKMPNTFPTVIGPARIESDYNQNVYIFDAPGTMFTAYIRPAEPIKPWNLKIRYYNEETKEDFASVDADSYEDDTPQENWIHFVSTDNEGKPTGYLSEMNDPNGAGTTITVVLNDFVEQRTLEQENNRGSYYYIETQEMVERLKKDYRTAYIELYTSGTAEPYRLLVRQYNALTVYTSSTNYIDGFRATTRLDYGCHFDLQTGLMVREDTAAVGWGYRNSVPRYITGDDKMDYNNGAVNVEQARKRYENDNWGGDNYRGSLYQKMRKQAIEIDENNTNKGTKIWYMPAYHEMWGIAHYVNPNRDTGDACQELFRLNQGDTYWCSTAKDYDISYTLYIPAGTIDYMREDKRTSVHYARPVRKFNDQQELPD